MKYHINQNLSAMYTFSHSKIEDTSLYIDSDPSPTIQQFDGILTQARYFKTFRRHSPISYVVKSLALEYSGRTGYYEPFNHSGYSENLAYYPTPYSPGGKVSFGFVINRDLMDNQ